MTGHPEAVLARELALCYTSIALVTDLDAGLNGEEAVSQEQVFRVFAENTARLRALLLDVVAALPDRAAPAGAATRWTASTTTWCCREERRHPVAARAVAGDPPAPGSAQRRARGRGGRRGAADPRAAARSHGAGGRGEPRPRRRNPADRQRPVGRRRGRGRSRRWCPAVSMTDAVGRVLAGPVRSGEALTDVRLVGSSLLTRGGRLVAAPVRLADPATAGLLHAGDRVDVLAVRTDEPQAVADDRRLRAVGAGGAGTRAVRSRRRAGGPGRHAGDRRSARGRSRRQPAVDHGARAMSSYGVWGWGTAEDEPTAQSLTELAPFVAATTGVEVQPPEEPARRPVVDRWLARAPGLAGSPGFGRPDRPGSARHRPGLPRPDPRHPQRAGRRPRPGAAPGVRAGRDRPARLGQPRPAYPWCRSVVGRA